MISPSLLTLNPQEEEILAYVLLDFSPVMQ
jgi:hypothetical protein